VATLENLTAKILGDSKLQADGIVAAANAEAARIVEDMTAGAEAEKQRIIADGTIAAQREEEHIVSGRTLAVRDENLAAKQVTLNKVFSEALNRLNGMSEGGFMSFLTGYLSTLDLDGEVLILPAKYGVKDIAPLNSALKAAGKKGNLVLSEEDRGVEGGFILVKGGIEQNNTFESLLGFYRYELEGDVIGALY
jgi:V/A-type H+-transporting ATPase subunit E